METKECNFCLKLKLIEYGVLPGQKIKLVDSRKDLWKISVLDGDLPIMNLALRKNEFKGLFNENNSLIHII